MKLYQVPYSHYSAKVRLILLEKNIEVELPPIPGMDQDDPEYTVINPTGLVPCLVDGDFALGESEVIAEYLEERYPEHAMLPEHVVHRAESRWLSRIHDLYIAPQLTVLYCRSRDGETTGRDALADVDKLFDFLDLVENAVAPTPYFFGDRFCLSDATLALSYWYALVLSAECGKPLPESRYPDLSHWFSAVSRRESFITVIRDCKVALGIPDDDQQIAA